MNDDAFVAMLEVKLRRRQISQQEFELILSTHQLGVGDAEDEYIEVEPLAQNTDATLTLSDLNGLGPDDQVWLLNQVKADRMTVGEAVVVAKQGPPSVSRARRAQLQREADRKRGELHTQHALAAATTAAVYVSVVRVATAELIRLEQAATVIQTAALVYCARQQAQRLQATLAIQTVFRMLHAVYTAQQMADGAIEVVGTRVLKRSFWRPKPKATPALKQHTPEPAPTGGGSSPSKPPQYLLKPLGETAGFELILTRDTRPDGTLESLGLEVAYKKASYFGRGTKAVIVAVERGTPADEARLEVGDQITEICSVKLTTLTADQCRRLLQESRVRMTVTKSITAKEQRKVSKVVEHATRAKAREASRAPAGRASPHSPRKPGRPAPAPPVAAAARGQQRPGDDDGLYDRPESMGSIIYDAAADEGVDQPNDGAPSPDPECDQLYAEVNRGGQSRATPPLPERASLARREVEEYIYDSPLAMMPLPSGDPNPVTATADSGTGESAYVYDSPSPSGAANIPLYAALYAPAVAAATQPDPVSGGSDADADPLYETPTPDAAIRAAEENLYEVPSPCAPPGGHHRPFTDQTGYGDSSHEPVYETIPGAPTIDAPNAERPSPTVFGSGTGLLVGDDEYEEVAPGPEGGWGGPKVFEVAGATARKRDLVWTVVNLSTKSATVTPGPKPEYIVSYPRADAAEDGEASAVEYQVVPDSPEPETAPAADATTNDASVEYTEVTVAQNDGSDFQLSTSERFLGLRAALEQNDGENFPNEEVVQQEYAEYSELSTVGVSLEWFAGSMGRRQCETAVAAGQHGTFLIRESTSGDQFVLCVNDGGAAVNFPIALTAQRSCTFGGKKFDNLHDLVDHLRTTAVKGRDGKPLRLTDAAPGGTVLVLQVAAPPPPPPPPLPPPPQSDPRRAPPPPPRPSSAEQRVGRPRPPLPDSSGFAAEILDVKLRPVSRDPSVQPMIAPEKSDLFSILMSEMVQRRLAMGSCTSPDADHRDSFACVEYMET